MAEKTKKYDVCFFCFEEFASDARTLNLARTLADDGKSVAVVSFGKAEAQSKFLEENIHYFNLPMPKVNRFWKQWFKYHILSKKIRKELHADTVIASDFYSLYTANVFAKKCNAKLIYDSREVYSALGPLYKNPIKQKIISILELKLIKNVNKVIVTGELDAEYLQNHFKINVPFEIIMNLPPYRGYHKTNLLRETFKIPNEAPVILYQGVILPGRGVKSIIRSLPFYEEAYFCIIGWGKYEEEIRREAELLGVTNRVIFCGKLSYDDLHSYTCSADIGICFIEPITFSYKLALPNKLFEYCMARIPTLASDLPAIRKIISEHHFGKLIPNDASPEQIANAMKMIIAEKDKYIEYCNQAAQIFSYNNQVSKIIRLTE